MKESEKKTQFYKHIEESIILQNKRMYKEAIKECEKASQIIPEHFLPFHNIGILYYHLGDTKKSEEFLKKSFEMKPENKLTALNIATLYYSQKKYTQAIKYFKKGIQSHYTTPLIYKYFLDALYKKDKYKEATKYLKLAIDTNDFETDFHLLLIDTYIKLENFQEALDIFSLIPLSDKNASKMQEQKKLILKGLEYRKKIKIENRKQIKSLCEYIEEIGKIKKNNEDTYIYRGQDNKYLPLIPSLYRNNSYIEDENNIIKDFNLKAEAFFNHELETFDGVDRVVLMQHYGIPTRLLDFTESPLIALFFALEKISSDSYSSAPCVYAINTKAFSHNKKGLLFTSKQIASESKDTKKIFKYSKGTCAFSPKLKNKRLIAQKGVFVLFNEDKPLEISITKENIIKFEIAREHIDSIKKDLNNIGITPSTIYPDFTGLAEEIKTPHKFIEEEQVLNLDNELIPTESFLNNALKIINTTKL